MSRVVILTDVPADQKDTVVQVEQDDGATVQVIDQGDGSYTITATYPDPPAAGGADAGGGGADAGGGAGGPAAGSGEASAGGAGTAGAGAGPAVALPSGGTYNAKYKTWFNAIVSGGFYSSDPDNLGVFRSIRTNNPGALNYSNWQSARLGFVAQTPDDGHGNKTTIYSAPEYGIGAWYHLLANVYGYASAGGAFTIGQLARSYAGNDAAQSAVDTYVAGWSHCAGSTLTAQTVIHLSTDSEILLLGRAMFKHEAAGQIKISDDQILCGIRNERNNSWPTVKTPAAAVVSRTAAMIASANLPPSVALDATTEMSLEAEMPQPPAIPQAIAPAAATPPARFAKGPGLLALLLLLAAFAGNIHWAPTNLLGSWLLTLVAIAASLALFGLGSGRWEATFIDNRNRMSLSKLQVILWTVAIFSALLSASCFNAGAQSDVSAIMGIVVDPKLWGLLGISVTTAVGMPLTLSGKASRVASDAELADTQKNLAALTKVPAGNIQNDGHILIKVNQADARWSDLIRGDDVGNGDTIDFSKVQQLYFTLLTLLIFSLAVAKEFGASTTAAKAITALPVPDAGFLGLLAASGAGYLIYKGMSHSQDAQSQD